MQYVSWYLNRPSIIFHPGGQIFEQLRPKPYPTAHSGAPDDSVSVLLGRALVGSQPSTRESESWREQYQTLQLAAKVTCDPSRRSHCNQASQRSADQNNRRFQPINESFDSIHLSADGNGFQTGQTQVGRGEGYVASLSPGPAVFPLRVFRAFS
jgi:hypothetical protein